MVQPMLSVQTGILSLWVDVETAALDESRVTTIIAFTSPDHSSIVWITDPVNPLNK